MGKALSILLPLVVIGYALWLIAGMLRRRKRGQCALGGCMGCPLAGGCEQLKRLQKEEETRHDGDKS